MILKIPLRSSEDVLCHLEKFAAAAGLVAEMNAGLQKLFHIDHISAIVSFLKNLVFTLRTAQVS